MKEEVTSVCEECGASVYKEHLDSGIARYEGGKLLCTHCVAEYERSHDGVVGGGDSAVDEQTAPIAFEDDDDDVVDSSQSRIHVMSGSMLGGTEARL